MIIRPLTLDDLPDLSRFLTDGFHAPSDAPFAAEDVLRWKYFDSIGPEGDGIVRSELALDSENGRIVGHVGICPVRFQGMGLPAEGISALHGIDWLGSEGIPGVGAKLLWKSHKRFEAAYVVVATDVARVVTARAGYETVAKLPVFRNVLNPGYRLKVPGQSHPSRIARAVSDMLRKFAKPAMKPTVAVELRQIEAFGDEVRPIVQANHARAAFTSRDPALLNHMLRYPRGGITGWLVASEGHDVGFAILSVVATQGAVLEGRILECMLESDDPGLWHASIFALTAALKRLGVDVAIGFGSTPLVARSLRFSGYFSAYELDFTLRDRGRRISRDLPFHLTPFEADYAYT